MRGSPHAALLWPRRLAVNATGTCNGSAWLENADGRALLRPAEAPRAVAHPGHGHGCSMSPPSGSLLSFAQSLGATERPDVQILHITQDEFRWRIRLACSAPWGMQVTPHLGDTGAADVSAGYLRASPLNTQAASVSYALLYRPWQAANGKTMSCGPMQSTTCSATPACRIYKGNTTAACPGLPQARSQSS